MTRRDYVLLAKALGVGFGELAKANKESTERSQKGKLAPGAFLPPNQRMEGYVGAMGALAIYLREDNSRFDIPMFFKNISEVASMVCGDKIELDAIEAEVDEEDPDLAVIVKKDSAGVLH